MDYNTIKNKKNRNMNKRAAETLTTWIIVFLFIVLIYLGYLFFVLVNYGEQSFFGKNTKIVIKENTVTSIDHQLFLLTLSKEIEINGKKITIISGIKKFIDDFFEIKNDREENFIEVFGLQQLEHTGSALQQDMYARGFDDDDWQALIDAQKKVQESETIQKIIEELNRDCSNYFFKIPFGVITNEGLKNIDVNVFDDTPAKLLLYTPTISYITHYRGERIEIKFRKSVDCI